MLLQVWVLGFPMLVSESGMGSCSSDENEERKWGRKGSASGTAETAEATYRLGLSIAANEQRLNISSVLAFLA